MLSTAFKNYVCRHLSPETAPVTDRQFLLALARGSLPASDLASVPAQVLESYADHSLFLRTHCSYCRDIPEDIFLHYVFYPRINSEDLTDCRPFFYQKLSTIVEGLGLRQAALAVNRWCAAHMTYESTDPRTISPLTAYSCGLGRCGEESVFVVSALRSVGIPARQIYVPWWSHCDDNHAWVEIYTDGDWHFLGACEPEPILDRGWFSRAATRAMVVCSRSFFSYGLESEAVISHQGPCIHHNQTARYGQTTLLTVTVLDSNGPVVGADVHFAVLNMADFAEIARLTTDHKGQVTLETGLGSLLVEARRGQYSGFSHIDTTSQQAHTLLLTFGPPEAGQLALDFVAPTAGTQNHTDLSPCQQAEKTAVLAECRRLRQDRIDSRFLPEYELAPPPIRDCLRLAGGNASVLWEFYQAAGDQAQNLLQTLTAKDYRDVTPEVLRAFLGMEQGPRIGFEVLSPWKQPILQALTPEQQAEFQAAPDTIWHWLREHFQEQGQRFYRPVWLQPDAALRLGAADENGRRLLFVAICRTLGIRAELAPPEGLPRYHKNGTWHQAANSAPTVRLETENTLPYFQSWTLARWEEGFQTLDLSQSNPPYILPTGRYRLITTNRLPNGNQLAQLRILDLQEDARIPLPLRPADPGQMVARYPLSMAACPLELRLYLQVGTEPTEHILNELLAVKHPAIPVHLLVPHTAALEDPVLQKVLQTVSNLQTEVADFTDGTVEALARAMYLEPEVWPLLILTDGHTGYYGHCGYGVNTLPLALGLAEYL